MWIYLICFAISCLLLKISINQNKILKLLLITVAVLLPCLLAGVRAEIIGTDVHVYVKPLFNLASYAENFTEYLNMNVDNIRQVKDYEIGFTSMIFFLSKLFGNLQVILFTIEVLVIIPIYLGLRKYEQIHDKIWLCMLVFFLMFYNTSLNAMRQYIGIAFVFYGLSAVINNKEKKMIFYFSLIIGYLFHKSSILGILIYILYNSIENQKNIKILLGNKKIDSKTLLFSLIILVGVAMVLNSEILELSLTSLGFSRYSRYIYGDTKFSFFSILKIFPPLLILVINKKEFKRKIKNNKFYTIVFILSIIISQLSTANVRAGRIGYIFSIFNIILFPLLCKCSNSSKKNTFIIIVYLLAYWYYMFVICGSNETIPYKMYTEGIW